MLSGRAALRRFWKMNSGRERDAEDRHGNDLLRLNEERDGDRLVLSMPNAVVVAA